MKASKVINFVFNYIAAVALAVVFALVFDASTGWFFTIVFLLAPILSVVYTVIMKRFLSAEMSVLSSCVNKGESVSVTVTVKNSAVLPSPPIKIFIADTCGVPCINSKIQGICVMPKSEESIELTFSAKIWGKSEIGTERIIAVDYFGIFSSKPIRTDNKTAVIEIIPDIAEISADSPVVNNAFTVSAFSDDTDETAESKGQSVWGMPGYEHREYVPGDPLKRVNWKLSAKKQQLLVRLDDEVPSPHISIVLDCVFSADDVDFSKAAALFSEINVSREELLCLVAQKTVEDSLGIAQQLLGMNRTLTYYLFDEENGWIGYSVDNEGDIISLTLALASFSFSRKSDVPDEQRIPIEEIRENKGGASVIFCTPCCDDGISSLLNSDNSQGGSKGDLFFTIYDCSR